MIMRKHRSFLTWARHWTPNKHRDMRDALYIASNILAAEFNGRICRVSMHRIIYVSVEY